MIHCTSLHTLRFFVFSPSALNNYVEGVQGKKYLLFWLLAANNQLTVGVLMVTSHDDHSSGSSTYLPHEHNQYYDCNELEEWQEHEFDC